MFLLPRKLPEVISLNLIKRDEGMLIRQLTAEQKKNWYKVVGLRKV